MTRQPALDTRPDDEPEANVFRREADGSVRLRVRFTSEEATLIEQGAGETPLVLYIHKVLGERARFHVRKRAEAAGDVS